MPRIIIFYMMMLDRAMPCLYKHTKIPTYFTMKSIFSLQNMVITLLLITNLSLFAQTPTDGIMMPKGSNCTMLSYGKSTWTNYWQGETKRSNANLGTFTAQNVMLMNAIGINDKLNVLVSLPYIWTGASTSYLSGQKGVQDLSAWLKYQIIGNNTFKIFATLGASVPTTNYVADFLPFSIGLHTKTASGRLIANYSIGNFYATAQGGATLRSNVKIDRNSFIFSNKLYESNEMIVPHAADGSLTLGFLNKRFQTAVTYDHFGCLSGDDIRYNDAPILTNNMKATSIGWFGKVFIGKAALLANVGKVLNGRNVGEGVSYGGGLLYTFQMFDKATKQQSK
jgi:hypothetical protein